MSARAPGLEDATARSARLLAGRILHRSRQAASVRHALSQRRHARGHAHRARGRADLRLGRLCRALAVGPALQPGDRDGALSNPAREGRRNDRVHQQPGRQRLPMLRLDPDLPGLRRPDGRARRCALHGSAGAAREELSAQGRRARHGSGSGDGPDAGGDDAPGVGRTRRAPAIPCSDARRASRRRLVHALRPHVLDA